MAKVVQKGKKKRKPKQPSQKWKKYNISSGKAEASPYCPRCGPGIFLAKHKGRTYCGKCSYTVFEEKK